MWTSPFRKSNYETHTVRKYVVPFALISAALIASDSKTSDVLPNTVDQQVWSGRVSQIGGAYSLAGGSAALYLIGKVTGNEHARETGNLSLRAIAHTQLLTFGMKQITNRQRPINDKALSGFWNGGDAFPSGHSATSFAVATVVAYEYREQIIVPIAAYSLATLVAASRVSARRHWLSDVFVGSSMGFLVGRYMYKTHHDPNLPGSNVERNRTSRFVPQIGFSGLGPVLSWEL